MANVGDDSCINNAANYLQVQKSTPVAGLRSFSRQVKLTNPLQNQSLAPGQVSLVIDIDNEALILVHNAQAHQVEVRNSADWLADRPKLRCCRPDIDA